MRRVESTGSTNADLADEARAGGPEQVLVAAHQRAGRGRMGRDWVAPSGASLLCSVLTRPRLDPEDLALTTTAMGVASVHAVGVVAGVRLGCKWPNDLVTLPDTSDGVDADLKVSGILSEAVSATDDGPAVVVGIGINVNWPDDMGAELSSTATSLRHLRDGVDCDLDALLTQLLVSFEYYLDLAEREPDGLIEVATSVSATVGRTVRVTTPTEEFTATATGLRPDGELLIDRDGVAGHVSVGDVVHVRAH